MPPTWRRDGSQNAHPSDVYGDIQTSLENMLTLGEDIVATAVHHRRLTDFIDIAEIPVEKRDKQIPKRLALVFNEKRLPKPQSP